MVSGKYVDLLRRSGYKITPQRLTVIKYIEDHSPGHFKAEDIYQGTKEEEPTITLATVYNILRALREAGAVRSFEANGSMWFETNTELHGNMVCRVCGRIFDVPLGEEVQNALITSEHSIESVSIIMNGVCRECRSRMPPP